MRDTDDDDDASLMRPTEFFADMLRARVMQKVQLRLHGATSEWADLLGRSAPPTAASATTTAGPPPCAEGDGGKAATPARPAPSAVPTKRPLSPGGGSPELSPPTSPPQPSQSSLARGPSSQRRIGARTPSTPAVPAARPDGRIHLPRRQPQRLHRGNTHPAGRDISAERERQWSSSSPSSDPSLTSLEEEEEDGGGTDAAAVAAAAAVERARTRAAEAAAAEAADEERAAARERGQAAWESLMAHERQEKLIGALQGALEAEAQARERAEGAAEEAGQLGFDFARTLDELKVALQEEHGGRQRAEALAAAAADAGKQALEQGEVYKQLAAAAVSSAEEMSEEVETMRRAVNGHAQNVAELEAGLQTERCAREGAEKQTSELSATRADLAEVQDSLAQSRVHCEAVERQQEAAERETEQLRAQLAELARSSQEKTAALQARAAEDVSALGAANDRIAARMAESYGSAMVPREWLAAVLEQMQAHGGAHAAQTAALTKLLFAAQQKDAESQQLLVDTLRLADRHRAATKIQVAFLRHVRRASECTASQGATSLAQADVELQRTVRAFNQASEELGSAHEQLGHTAWRSAQLEQCLGRTASYHTRHRAAGTIQTAVRGRMYRTTSGKLREQRQRLEAHVATLTEQLEADWRRSDALEVRLQLRGEHVAALTLAAAEAARTLAAAEAARTLAEAEARKQGAEAQAQEQARSEAEEAARLATEETEEARRVAAEQEVARLSAEERVARASADAQVARVNAMEQVTRVAAEEKAKRLAVEANAREQVEQAHLAMVVLAEPPAVEELEEDHSDSTEGGELLALLCSSTSELAQSVLEKEALQLYARINRNVDGFLSRSELIRALRSDLQLQSSLELPSSIREGQMQSFERIFRQMDIDDKRGISAGEFVEYVLATWIAHSAPTAPAPQPKPIDPPGTPDGGRPQQKQLVVPVMTPDSSSSVASEDDEETLLYYNGRCLTPSRRGAHAAAMGRSHRAESTTSVTGGSSVSTLLFDESMSSEDSDQQPMDLQRTSTEEFHHSRRSLMSIIAPESKSQDAKGLSSIGELKAQLKQSAAELESVTEALGMLAQEAQATTSTTGGHGPHMIDHYTVDRPGVILAEFYSEQQRQMRGGSWRASHDRLRVAIRDLATEVADSQAHKRALQTQLLQQQNASQVAATSLRALEAKLADARTQAFALQGAARPMLEARADARTAVAAMEVRMRLKDEEVERMQADMEQWKIAQEAQRYEEIAELESMHKTQYEQTRLQKVGSLQAELELSAIRHLFHKLASEHPNQLDCAGFAVALEHMRGQQQDAAAARAFFKQLEKDKDDCISMSTFIRFWRSFKVDNGSQLLAATSNDAQKTVKVADESAVAAAADLCVQRIFASIELRGDSVEKLINYRQFISWQSQLREAHTGGHHISDEELQATMVIWHEAADASSRRGVIDGHVDWTGMIEVIQQMLKNEVIRITAGGHVLPMVDALGMDETRPRKRGKTGFAESLIAAAGTAAGAQSSQAGATATSSQPIARPTALHGIFGDIHTAVSLLSSGLRSHEDAIQRQREEIHRRREIEQQQRQALVTEEQEQVQQQSELATEMQQLAESAERAVTEKLLQQAVELAATQVKQETRLRSVEAERDRARESAARHAAVATAWARAHPYGASPEEAAEGQASGCSLEESTEFELTPMEQLEQRLVQDMLADSGYDEEEEAKEVEDDDLSQFDAYVAEMAILRSLEAATDDLQPQPGATGDPEAEAEGGGDGSSRREAALLLLDRCRRVLGRAGAPRRGTGVGARLAEIEAALAASAASAHWLIAVRAELERRAAALQEPNYLDAAARVRLLRDRSATRIQSTLRGFLTRRWYFEQLEREQEYLELEVKLEANQHWNTVRAAVANTRPVRQMLVQLLDGMSGRSDQAQQVLLQRALSALQGLPDLEIALIGRQGLMTRCTRVL